jgi:CBS domain-containing protein
MSTSPVHVPSPLAGVEAGTVMHPGLLSVSPGTPCRMAARVMAANQVHAVVVAGARAEVLRDLDVIASALEDPEARLGSAGRPLPSVRPNTSLTAAARAMTFADASHALVHDGGTHPIGMLSSFDIAAVIAGRSPRIARIVHAAPARPAPSESRLDHVVVGDVMHAGVVSVPPRTALPAMAAVLADRRMHAVVVEGTVTDGSGERLVHGVATDMDLLGAAAGDRLDVTAGDIAGTDPLVVDRAERLDVAARRLVEHGVSHAIVTDDDAGGPVGVLSTLDVLGVLAVGA